MKELEPRAQNALHVITTVYFSPVDRLNLLLFGKAEVRLQIETEHPVGRMETTDSRITVKSLPRWWRVALWKLRGSPDCSAEALPANEREEDEE